MQEKEYYTVTELSIIHKTCTRNIRKIISQLKPSCTKEMIHKDSLNRWKVLHTLSSKFKPKNKRKEKYYALTIDPCRNYSNKEIDQIMQYAFTTMNDPNLEINYVIEQKKLNGQNHLHCYINCNQRSKLMQCLRLGFSNLSYKVNHIHDLQGWKNYITKEGNKIKTIKN